MTIAVYAGSFDPITAGHESIVRQAARIFSHVRVLVAVNPSKDVLFETDERVEMIAQTFRRMPQVSVDSTDGLVVEYARDMGASYLIRGVRGATESGALGSVQPTTAVAAAATAAAFAAVTAVAAATAITTAAVAAATAAAEGRGDNHARARARERGNGR